MTGPARPARARARGFLPVLYTQRRGHCERGLPRAPAPPAPHAPALPARHGLVGFLPSRPHAKAPGLGWGPCLSALRSHRDPPPSRSDASSPPPPHGHHLCHYLHHGPGRAGSPIWALRPPHPAGLGFVGNQASWLFMKNPEPRLGARPTLPGALPSALSPPGPGTTVAGPTQDQGAWASPLSQLLGRGDGGFPSPHLWLFPHPLEYPRKNKTAELHSSQLLSPEEATSAERGGRGGGRRGRSPGFWFGESGVVWVSWGRGDSAPWWRQKT